MYLFWVKDEGGDKTYARLIQPESDRVEPEGNCWGWGYIPILGLCLIGISPIRS